MEVKKQILVVNACSQLMGLPDALANQLENSLKQMLEPALEEGITRGGVSITADDIKTKLGADMVSHLEAKVAIIRKSIEDLRTH